MRRESLHGEHRELVNPPLGLIRERDNRAEQIQVHCVHCYGRTMGISARVSLRVFGFGSTTLTSAWRVCVFWVSPLGPGTLYSLGPGSSAEHFWQISTDKLSKAHAPSQRGGERGDCSLYAAKSCLKLWWVVGEFLSPPPSAPIIR